MREHSQTARAVNHVNHKLRRELFFRNSSCSSGIQILIESFLNRRDNPLLNQRSCEMWPPQNVATRISTHFVERYLNPEVVETLDDAKVSSVAIAYHFRKRILKSGFARIDEVAKNMHASRFVLRTDLDCRNYHNAGSLAGFYGADYAVGRIMVGYRDGT